MIYLIEIFFFFAFFFVFHKDPRGFLGLRCQFNTWNLSLMSQINLMCYNKKTFISKTRQPHGWFVHASGNDL